MRTDHLTPAPLARPPRARASSTSLQKVTICYNPARAPRTRRITWHRRSMLTATVFAALFLVVYVTRYLVLGSKIFPGEGVSRIVYLAILIPHENEFALFAVPPRR